MQSLECLSNMDEENSGDDRGSFRRPLDDNQHASIE